MELFAVRVRRSVRTRDRKPHTGQAGWSKLGSRRQCRHLHGLCYDCGDGISGDYLRGEKDPETRRDGERGDKTGRRSVVAKTMFSYSACAREQKKDGSLLETPCEHTAAGAALIPHARVNIHAHCAPHIHIRTHTAQALIHATCCVTCIPLSPPRPLALGNRTTSKYRPSLPGPFALWPEQR